MQNTQGDIGEVQELESDIKIMYGCLVPETFLRCFRAVAAASMPDTFLWTMNPPQHCGVTK